MRLRPHVSGAVERAVASLPSPIAAWVDLWRPSVRDVWGGPFNGQFGRQALMKELLDRIDFCAVIETGTFRGVTTEWFAQVFAGPVFTVEINERYALYAQHRLRPFQNVKLIQGDSRLVLRRLLTTELVEPPTLCYLDAHWRSELPLWDEVRIIRDVLTCAVIVVDDFRVDDDPGYMFDSYGDASLSSSDMPSDVRLGLQAYWPTLSSQDESGSRRGSIVFGVGEAIVQALSGSRCLRPAWSAVGGSQ